MSIRGVAQKLYRRHLLSSLLICGIVAGALITSGIGLSSILWELNNRYYWKYAIGSLILELPAGVFIGAITAFAVYVVFRTSIALKMQRRMAVFASLIAALIAAALLCVPVWFTFWLPQPALPAAISNVVLLSTVLALGVLWYPIPEPSVPKSADEID